MHSSSPIGLVVNNTSSLLYRQKNKRLLPYAGNKKNATGTILAVIIPLVVVLILLVVFYACWIKRKKAIKEYSKKASMFLHPLVTKISMIIHQIYIYMDVYMIFSLTR